MAIAAFTVGKMELLFTVLETVKAKILVVNMRLFFINLALRTCIIATRKLSVIAVVA